MHLQQVATQSVRAMDSVYRSAVEAFSQVVGGKLFSPPPLMESKIWQMDGRVRKIGIKGKIRKNVLILRGILFITGIQET